ncbi:putative metal-binding motif-containing protein [Pendulispora albinea]|uniref:Metal-binding motif-containing protein n=1 Tax=Pendulispora albinea TaxID=2741071 RepID=A0ABZ2LP84_9BACT
MIALRRFGLAAFTWLCALLVFAGGGCEAIVTADPPGGWSCDGSFDAGTCPEGQRCLNAKCVPCPNGNCTRSTCEEIDADKDGYTLCGKSENGFADRDCDDNDPEVHPNAAPKCNGKDNDCSGKPDDPCPDGSHCASASKECVSENEDCTKKPGSCIPPQTCDPGTKRCFARSSKKLGDGCSATAECEFDKGAFCASKLVLPDDVVRDGGICTQACCTSSQCPTDFVCFGAGTGGNYCVHKGKLGRLTVGGKNGGETCGSGTECRSGICGGNKKCQDTCCHSGQCTNKTKCLVMPLQGNGASVKYVLGCGDPPGEGTGFGNRCEVSCGLLCGNYPLCGEGVCDKEGTTCRAPCCGSAGCGGSSCGNVTANGRGDDVITACTGSRLQPGPKQLGQDCTAATECATNNCLQDLTTTAKYCSDACCTDADCASAGLVCRPYDSGAKRNYLRCQRQITALAQAPSKQ